MRNFLIVIFALMVTGLQAQCHKNNSSARNVSYTYHTDDIVDIAASSDDFSTLVAAVKAADLVGTLKSSGPFTVFAPTNAAFDKLPDGTVASLLEPSNKSTLASILTYHVVSGKFGAADIINAIKLGGGTANLKTVQGGKLIAKISGNNVILVDEKGGKSVIAKTDLEASNGYIHVIDTVVLPK
ncbi:MAG: fasciclin domain-containing protein [Bacteroidota bacterium]